MGRARWVPSHIDRMTRDRLAPITDTAIPAEPVPHGPASQLDQAWRVSRCRV